MISTNKLEDGDIDYKSLSNKELLELKSRTESMLSHEPFQVSTIHDAYQCHPNYAEPMKQTYREILAELANMNLLNDICSQIVGYDLGIEIADEGLAGMILNSSYAIS